jgi:ACS family allantoate permease-like MFS transporter
MQFSSTVINGFGYSKFQAMLVSLPGGFINFSTIWASALIPRFFPGTRIYTGIGLTFVPLLGSALLLALPSQYKWGIVASTWLASCSAALLSCAAALMASNVKGNTKKSTISCGFFISYCVGCIVSPQAWLEADAPRYTKGCILSIASWIALAIGFAVYGFAMRRENLSRDQRAELGHEEYIIPTEHDGHQAGVKIDSDLTDVQDKAFRYTL